MWNSIDATAACLQFGSLLNDTSWGGESFPGGDCDGRYVKSSSQITCNQTVSPVTQRPPKRPSQALYRMKSSIRSEYPRICPLGASSTT